MFPKMHCAIRREVQCKWGQKQLHSDFSRCGQALPMLGNCKLHQLVSGTEQGWQSLHPVQTAFRWTKPKCLGPLRPMIYNTAGVKIKTPHSPPSVFSQLRPSTCWRAIKPNLHLYTSANIHIKNPHCVLCVGSDSGHWNNTNCRAFSTVSCGFSQHWRVISMRAHTHRAHMPSYCIQLRCRWFTA